MGRGSTQRRAAAAIAVAAALALAGAAEALAQLGPGGQTSQQQDPTVPTLLPPQSSDPSESTTTTTAPPSGQPGAPAPAPASPSDPGAPPEGDGGDHGAVGRVIPAEAQAIMDSIARTPPGNNDALVQGAALVAAAGVPQDEAVRAVFGRFPVLGPTRWSDDWYYPRWTGTTFRFHQGLDMFAPYGTPVAAVVDGVVRIGENALGGLTVRVVQPDGTYWYYAHLSGIAEGLVDGQPVTTGQVLGYVGTSGNAVGTPPHLHFGVYPQGGGAAPPKPVVDAWVVEGANRVNEILAQLNGVSTESATAPVGTGMRASGTTIGPPTAGSPARSELLWATAANPAGGAVQVAEAAAAAAGDQLDWDRRAATQRAFDLAWSQASDRADQLLAPLTHPALRHVVEALRAASPESS